MIGDKKYHFLEHQFPNAGNFYADTKCLESIFIGELEIIEGRIRIKVLERGKKYSDFGHYYGTLYANLSSRKDHELVAWSFFNCRLNQDIKCDSIEFESFSSHSNGNWKAAPKYITDKSSDSPEIPLPEFVTEKSKFKKVSLSIDGLDRWLWKQPWKSRKESDNNFRHKFIRKDGASQTWCYVESKGVHIFDKSLISISIPIHRINKKIDIGGETSLVFYSEPSTFGEFPDCKVSQSCHIDIVTNKEHDIRFFYRVVNILLLFFTLIGYRKCKIHSLSYFNPARYKNKSFVEHKRIEFYNNYLTWVLSNKEDDYWFATENMLYHKIEKDFPNAIKLFFEKKPILHNIINFVTDISEIYVKEHLEVYISQLTFPHI